MIDIDLINKKKIRADNLTSGVLILSYVVFALFLKLEVLVSIIIYPHAALTSYGVLKIIDGLNKKHNADQRNPNKIFLGVFCTIFSLSIMYFILTRPGVSSQIIISLISFPILNVGFAAIIKGAVIDLYPKVYRELNISIGIVTIIICFLMFTSILYNFLVNIVILSVLLLINILSRAALYLSEYGLSLLQIKNFRLFLYIVSDYLVYVQSDGNILLSKLE